MKKSQEVMDISKYNPVLGGEAVGLHLSPSLVTIKVHCQAQTLLNCAVNHGVPRIPASLIIPDQSLSRTELEECCHPLWRALYVHYNIMQLPKWPLSAPVLHFQLCREV